MATSTCCTVCLRNGMKIVPQLPGKVLHQAHKNLFIWKLHASAGCTGEVVQVIACQADQGSRDPAHAEVVQFPWPFSLVIIRFAAVTR